MEVAKPIIYGLLMASSQARLRLTSAGPAHVDRAPKPVAEGRLLGNLKRQGASVAA